MADRPATLRKWLVLLSGPLLWSAHLGFVYAAATLDITVTQEAGMASRIAIALATATALAAIAWLGWSAWRGRIPRWSLPQEDLTALWRTGTAVLALLSFMGVLWQGLPAVLLPGDPSSHTALEGGTVPTPSPYR